MVETLALVNAWVCVRGYGILMIVPCKQLILRGIST